MALHHTPVISATLVDEPNGESLARWRAHYPRLCLDLGCGDARFALGVALTAPHLGVAGIDTCLDNVCLPRRSPPPNLRLIGADARGVAGMPELLGAHRITVNFPYGSLLRWVVDDSTACLDALRTMAAPGATLEIRINASALREIGAATDRIERSLTDAFARRREWSARFATMNGAALRAFPSTWARRIGHGRATTALEILARLVA